LGNQEA